MICSQNNSVRQGLQMDNVAKTIVSGDIYTRRTVMGGNFRSHF